MTDQHPSTPDHAADPATGQNTIQAPPPSPTNPAGWRFETKQVQAGHDPMSEPTHSRAIPIHQTTSYVFESAEQAAARFALSDLGPIYTRLTNPTNDIVEQRIAALEGGVGALLTASGMAAETLALVTLGGAGDNIVASPSLYGGTTNLLTHTLPRLGIETRFVSDPGDPTAWAALADERTIAFFGETTPSSHSFLMNSEALLTSALPFRFGLPSAVSIDPPEAQTQDMTSFWIPLGASSDRGSAQPETSPPVTAFAAAANSSRVEGIWEMPALVSRLVLANIGYTKFTTGIM